MKKKVKWVGIYCIVLFAAVLIARWSGKAVTVIAQNRPIERGVCIVIDAGHGGIDGGATSCTGKLESSFNLEIALRLNNLMQFLGYDTKLVRESDISVHVKGETISQKKLSDLKERVRIVNETPNALLLSIHQNIFSEEKYSGAQVFYGTSGESEILAGHLQNAFIANLNPGSRRRSKKSDGIYLLDHINCTGILIECGFLSNVREEALLRDKEYQKRICTVIACSVSTFLSNA